MLAEKHTDTPLFDLAHLKRYTGDDEGLQRELIGLWQDQARNCLGLMEMASDRSAWRAAVHTLKGASRGVGAFALGEVCEQVEEASEMNWPEARLALDQTVEATRTAFGDLAR